MPSTAAHSVGKQKHLKPVIVLLLLLAAFVLLLFLLPLRTAVQIGADEGFAATKAMLCLKGYHFYTEVWNDQPMLHTFLLAQVLKYVSPSILGLRLVTAAFALLLLVSVFLTSLRISGLLVAALTTAFLIASPGFLTLASSCMVEIPAITLPVAVLCLLAVGRPGKWPLTELLAGILFGAALHIKLNGAIYLPPAVFILWLRHRREPASGNRFAGPLLVFSAALAVSFLAVHVFIGEGSYASQFKLAWTSHIAPAKSLEYGSAADHPFEWTALLKNWDVTLPAIAGIILSLRQARRHPAAVLPVVWLGVTLAVFTTFKPWWTYYYPHNAIPLCWCAAIGLTGVGQHLISRRSRFLFILFAVYALGALGWMGARVYLQVAAIRNSPQLYSCLVFKEIEPFKPFTRYMFTDQPIYSFHAGIPQPPRLAVLSLKRFWSGDMTNDKLVTEMEAVKPGLILTRADTRELPYEALLEREYRLVYEDGDERLYALKTVIDQVNR